MPRPYLTAVRGRIHAGASATFGDWQADGPVVWYRGRVPCAAASRVGAGSAFRAGAQIRRFLRSGAWRAGAGLVKGGDEAGEQMGEGLALLVCPAADGTGELGAPVVVYL